MLTQEEEEKEKEVHRVVSGAPGEQLLAPVTYTNTSPRQQGPAPAPQPPTPPVTCPYTSQGSCQVICISHALRRRTPPLRHTPRPSLCSLTSSAGDF
ncbi:hypothetical protein Q5P01_009173 [Channa striata]|uniref:Uncharacterized protein n=1 Tax=Channa striata TaxID=64152 RepID=A0AA88N6A4_CHASR|nr:hypothetical protein Q5P01_009173 [Channa striata]